MNTRNLSPYELTQLAKHGINLDEAKKTQQPIEYLTGHADFCGLDFLVNPHVLIPRVETEGLVELTLQVIAEKIAPSKQVQIREVGSGSGAISISVAKHLENTDFNITLTASDISEKALELAKQNEHQVLNSSKITWLQADLLHDTTNKQIDILVANLPYIPSSRIAELDPSVKDFEPRLALDGGSNGFELIKKLLDQSITILNKNAVLLLEVDDTHLPELFKPWQDHFKITPFTDCFDKHRFIRLDFKS